MAERPEEEKEFLHLEPREDDVESSLDSHRGAATAHSYNDVATAPLLSLSGASGAAQRFRRRYCASWAYKRTRRLTMWIVVPLLIVTATFATFVFLEKERASQLQSWVKDRLPNMPTITWNGAGAAGGGRVYTNMHEYQNTNIAAGCASIPDKTREALLKAKKPMVRVVADGGTVGPKKKLHAPVSVCVLISLPQHPIPNRDPDSFPDKPVPGKGPDTVHMYLNSSDVIVTFPPLLPLPGQEHAEDLFFKDGSIVYYAETPIYNGGTYVVNADVEHSNWAWAQEWHNEGFNFTMSTGEPSGDTLGDHEWKDRPIRPNINFTVEGPRHLPALPPCSNESTAAQGKWYRYKNFPVLDRDLVDEWGYTWQGDYCHIEPFSAIDSLNCFENKTVHVWGDSMSRRLAKTLMSGGKWCLDPNAQCQDEDDRWGGVVPKLEVDQDGGIYVGEFDRGGHFEMYNTDNVTFGKNTTMFFEFVTATFGSSGTWIKPLFDEADRFLDPTAGNGSAIDYMHIRPGAVARAPPELAPADLVIVGFGAWDQAFTDKFDDYESTLTSLRDALIQAYPGIPIVMRLANGWCCRNTAQMFRRYTGGRIQEFDDRTRKVFQVDGATAFNGRFHIIDPANMNGRPDVIRDYVASDANHPRASHVRIEMQMMMNSVCRRDETGRAVFNDYVPPS